MFGLIPWPRPLTPRRRQALAGEIEEELRLHLALRTEENEHQGMTPEEAAADASERFGDLERIKTACLLAEDNHPLRVAARRAGTVALLAVGFGAFALAFALVQAVLLQPLRFADADRLVRLGEGWDDAVAPYEDFTLWRAENTSFERLTTFDAREHNLTGDGLPARIRTMQIGRDYFETFEVAPLLGRTFHSEEVETEAPSLVLLSEALWETRYRRSPTVLGRRIRLDGTAHTIVGVMPEEGQLSHVVDVWTPLPYVLGQERHEHYVVGRLRAGVSLNAARADLGTLAARVEAENPKVEAVRTLFYPLHGLYASPVRATLLVQFGAAVLLLLLVWAVVFRRAVGRAAVDQLSSAGPPGLVWSEACGMAFAAAGLGLGLAWLGRAYGYEALLGRWGGLFGPPGPGVVVLVLVLTVATAAGLAVAPRIAAARSSMSSVPLRRGLEAGLSVAAVALAVVLLVAFGQRAGPLVQAAQQPLGFDEAHIATVDLPMPYDSHWQDAAEQYAAILARVRAVPGVAAASFGRAFPLRPDRLLTLAVGLDPDRTGAARDTGETCFDAVAPRYFETMGVPLLEGRSFTAADSAAAVDVAVVNAAFAARHWPGEHPVGRQIDLGLDGRVRTVVGVVGDLRYFGSDGEPPAMAYAPHAQFAAPTVALVVRSSADPAGLEAGLRRAVQAVAPEVPFHGFRLAKTLRREAQRESWAALWLLGGVALLALLCALVGTAQRVAERAREQADRGAHDDVRVGSRVFAAWQPALQVIGVGVAFGLGLAFVLTQRGPPELLGAADATAFVGAFVGASLSLLAASLVPAWQARATTRVH